MSVPGVGDTIQRRLSLQTPPALGQVSPGSAPAAEGAPEVQQPGGNSAAAPASGSLAGQVPGPSSYTEARESNASALAEGSRQQRQQEARFKSQTKKPLHQELSPELAALSATFDRLSGSAKSTGLPVAEPQAAPRLSEIPAERRGAAAQELLSKGELTERQVGDYVAVAEGPALNPNLSLSRAGVLLGSSDAPQLQQAVASGLDRLLPADGAAPEAVHAFEKQLDRYFADPNVTSKEKIGVAEAMAKHSSNPTVRAATTLAAGRFVDAQKEQLAEVRRRLEASDDPHNLSKTPGGPLKITEHRMRLGAEIKELEATLPKAQAAASGLLAGPANWKPDLSSDPNLPRTPAGHLANYLEKYHVNSQFEQAKGLMRSLWDPPTGAVMDDFAKLTQRVREANQKTDGNGLGFLLEAGHQVLGVDPASKQDALDQQRFMLASVALQLATASGLGYLGVLLGKRLLDPSNQRAADQALRSGFSKAGDEGLKAILRNFSGGGKAGEDAWGVMGRQTRQALQRRVESQSGFDDGITRAKEEAQ